MIRYLIYFSLSIFLVLLLTNSFVIWITEDDIIENVDSLPEDWPILVLGTSSNFADGSENLFFRNRMKAAETLREKRGNSMLILSGAKESNYYNEPRDMLDALVHADIERQNIFLDSAGNNTFESIYNFKKMKVGDSLIVVTQKFHAYRTLLVCRYLNIHSKVYEAEAVSVDITNRPVLREILARFVAFFQFYLFKF